MSTLINQYYDYALMMQAAYGLFDPNDLSDEAIKGVLDDAQANFTLTQAQEFVVRFNAIDHLTNDDTGFSATLFRDAQDSGQAILAIRGTEPSDVIGLDGAADLEIVSSGIAFNQAISLYNYVNSLREGPQRQVALQSVTGLAGVQPEGVNVLYSNPLGQGVVTYYYIEEVAPIQGSGVLADGEEIVVSGHSLGGHLAAVASALFPELVSDVYTYNAPGYGGITQEAIHQITGNTGFLGFNEGIIHSLVGESEFGGDDTDVVSDLRTPFSPQENIFIEVNTNGDVGLAGHSKVQITDSLKLYGVFSTLDPSLTSADIGTFLYSGSNVAANSLESIATALAEFFNIDDSQIPQYVDGDNLSARNKYHEVISAIKGNAFYQLLSGDASISAVPSNIALLAAENTQAGRGYRYALVTLQSFVITGDLTGTVADDVVYDLNDGNGDRVYSDQYLQDRSKFLSLILTRNGQDISGTPTIIPSNDGIAEIFTDKTTGQEIQTVFSSPASNRIIFGINDGANSADNLDGGNGDDRIYGMAGSDILNGLAGDDYLEGGAGNDIYFIDYNDDASLTEKDTIFDNQGPNNNIKVQYESGGVYENLLGKNLTLLAKNGERRRGRVYFCQNLGLQI